MVTKKKSEPKEEVKVSKPIKTYTVAGMFRSPEGFTVRSMKLSVEDNSFVELVAVEHAQFKEEATDRLKIAVAKDILQPINLNLDQEVHQQ